MKDGHEKAHRASGESTARRALLRLQPPMLCGALHTRQRHDGDNHTDRDILTYQLLLLRSLLFSFCSNTVATCYHTASPEAIVTTSRCGTSIPTNTLRMLKIVAFLAR